MPISAALLRALGSIICMSISISALKALLRSEMTLSWATDIFFCAPRWATCFPLFALMIFFLLCLLNKIISAKRGKQVAHLGAQKNLSVAQLNVISDLNKAFKAEMD